MHNCLVTGGAGFIGSHLVERLVGFGYRTWCVDSFTDFYPLSRKRDNVAHLLGSKLFHLIEADVCDPGLFPDCEIDYVFHLAGQPGVRASWGPGFDACVRNNILATQRLLEEVSKRRVRSFVLASSSSVYGNGDGAPSRETDSLRPLSPYAASKVAAELLCQAYGAQFALPVAILRFFTVYGPRQRPDMALETFLGSALTGARFSVYGAREQTRDYTYVTDVVDALLAAAEREAAGVFNIGGGHPVSMQDCLRTIEEVTSSPLLYDMRPAKPGEALSTSADIQKAGAALGYRPAVKFKEGLAQQWRCMLARGRDEGSLQRAAII